MTVFASPCWSNALTLKERLAALRSVEAAPRVSEDGAGRSTSRLLDAWRQPPFDQGDLFARRLAADGLSEDDLAQILCEPAEVARGRLHDEPAWLGSLREAFDRSRAEDGADAGGNGDDAPSLVEIARPMLAVATERLRQALHDLARTSSLPFDVDSTVRKVTLQLASKLRNLLSRTLVLELNVARLQGTLDGETPEQRFRSFFLQLRAPERATALLSEYPVLARQMVRAIEHGVAFHLEFLRRLTSDWETIRKELGSGEDPGKLDELTGGVGDSHRKGRSVLVARFESGLRVVYKPRSLALDVHFQELLTWLDARGDHPPFRTLTILDRGDYGWVEFVEPRTCATPEEVERFYRRQGAYLALLYALDATDFHTDNLVAEGEHPVLLDLEALFHARAGGAAVDDPAYRALASRLETSVLRIGLLPQRVWGNGESEGVDVSGLGSVAGQLTPSPVPQWQKAWTDEMHLGRERMPVAVGNNRPTLLGADVDLLDHAEAIGAGFTAMYQLLERHRGELLAPAGPLARFAADEVRVILRGTQTYAALLRESFHPQMLRDDLDRAKLLDRLWGPVTENPHLARIIPAEIEDLTDGDIPMFTTRPGSRDLWSSSGARLPEFFDEPSMSHVRRRLEQLGPEDLEQQLWFVHASLATASGKAKVVRGPDPTRAEGTARREELIAAARAVGDELERRALQEAGAATWFGLTQLREGRWTLAPLGLDLYDGLPGVAMFLAHLAAVTGEERYAALARAALRTLRHDLPAVRDHASSIGAFTGLGGLIYGLTHLGVLLRDDGLLAEARATLGHLPPMIDRDEHLDVIGGSAGCIGALLSLHRHDRSEEVLALARRCGERLIATGKPMDRGTGWLTSIAPKLPYSGFSHGAAGIAWALLQLAAATGDGRFRRSALDAIAYERTLFSPGHRNWWDLRAVEDAEPGTAPAHCATTWCHGAPGIGLARLATLGILDDADVREEIRTAVRTVAESDFGYNHSLCHGDLGNLEILAAAARALDDPSLGAGAGRIARGILDDLQGAGWRCGNPLRVRSPGLMTGLAGIGYGLLRLAEPQRVPSVLLLEPPPSGGE